MTEPMRGAHPDSPELQRYADGAADVARDERLLAHVESCAECCAEVERIQRVTAALSLTSKAPSSLSARIESRRAAAATSRALASSPSRTRRFLLPVGLAAAAVLVMITPWAWREIRNERAVFPGEKGIPAPWPNIPQPISRWLFDRVITEWDLALMDSAAAAGRQADAQIHIRYDASADSPTGRDLALRAASYFASRGIPAGRIDVSGSRGGAPAIPPVGAVRITVTAPPITRSP